jgi:serine/threonine protein kinase
MDEPKFSEETKPFLPDLPVLTTPPEPTQIGRYRVVRLLGTGGFGFVYLGHDDDLNRPVAIKVPRPDQVSQPEDIEAYVNEARILASMDHPHIVPVYDVGRTEEGFCYVVSKYVDGCDLATKIHDKRPGFPESAALIATIAEAIHYAHTRGLIHRDIKPANILIDTSGKAFVADFGLALKYEDFGKNPGLTGTPAYMSPEQAGDEETLLDGRSDIFSLGVVLYELLTGRRPFRAESYAELKRQIISMEPRPPRQIDESIPKALEHVCCKAMAKAVPDRYTTSLDMAEDLRWAQQSHVVRGTLQNDVASNSPPITREPFANTTPPERIRGVEVRSVLGRTGCVVQITMICSFFLGLMLFMDAVVSMDDTKVTMSVKNVPTNEEESVPTHQGDEIQRPYSVEAAFAMLLIAVPTSYTIYRFVRSLLRLSPSGR